jgi:hypothetical protein
MIVSHEHRFIFMKSQKTGGTSLELALSRICGEDDIITPLPERHKLEREQFGGVGPRNFDVPIYRHRLQDLALILKRRGRRSFWQHSLAREARAWLAPSVWRDYFKFVVERNPWDRAISQYWFRMRKLDQHPTMLDFFRTAPQLLISNLDYYAIEGEVVVDHIMRYENLEDEIAGLGVQLGLGAKLELPSSNSGWRKDRRPYQEVLGQAEREVIAERCSREIDLLGYKF